MRKLLKTLLSLLIIMPAAALALGLGNVTLHSALNEPLNAEIELLSLEQGEIDSLQVTLADAQTFTRLGVDRPGILMLLRFGVEQKSSGEYVVKVTSRETMREPFISFLMDARWASGRLVREYTLLLDPPVTHADKAPVAASPVTAPRPTTVTTTQAAPDRPATPPAAATRSAPATSSPGELVYGPVKADDTLWAIARQMRPEGVSVQQMMMALLEANPYAFIDGNINRLKAGYVLRIDDPSLLRAMSQAEAAREVTRQTRDWEQRRRVAAERAAERAAPAASAPATAAVATPPRAEPELRLVTPEAEKGAETAAGSSADSETVAAVRQDLMLALESSASQRQENQELMGRIAAMEEQLADMERLLNLKNSDLALLQQQLREQGQEVELSSVQPEAAPVSPVVEEEPAPATPSETETVTTETAPVAPVVTPVEPRVERPVRTTPPPPPPPQPSFIEGLLADPMMLAAGGGVLVVLLILAALVVRRRRKGGFQESILSGGTSSMMAAKASENSETSFLSDLAISGMGGGSSQGEEGEVDPLTEADVFMAYGRNPQAEEVLKNALAETPERHELTAKLLELYYNTRNTAAFSELANASAEALQSKDDIWNKVMSMGHELLPDDEMFAGAADSPAAEGAKPSAKAPVSDDVFDIGLDLDELTAEMEGEAEGGDDLLDLSLDLSDDEETTPTKAKDESSSSEMMDLDLNLGTDEEETTPAKDKEESSSSEMMDFDLDLGTDEQETTALAQESANETSALDDLDLSMLDDGGSAEKEDEFSLDLDSAEDANEPVQASDNEFSLDLESDSAEAEEAISLDLDSDTAGADDDFSLNFETATEEPVSEESDFQLDMGDLDLGDQDSSEAPQAVESTDSDADEFGDLGDLDDDMMSDADEITTKLDLAQAYIEMGDSEGARSMLEEVVEAGSDEQKKQAQDLLSKI